MSKDWEGNGNSVYKIIGASNHSTSDRAEHEFYATSPDAIDALVSKIEIPEIVMEPCCGEGHLSERLKELGHKVWSYDIVDRGYGEVQNFFETLTLPYSLSLSLCGIGVSRGYGRRYKPSIRSRITLYPARSGAGARRQLRLHVRKDYVP